MPSILGVRLTEDEKEAIAESSEVMGEGMSDFARPVLTEFVKTFQRVKEGEDVAEEWTNFTHSVMSQYFGVGSIRIDVEVEDEPEE